MNRFAPVLVVTSLAGALLLGAVAANGVSRPAEAAPVSISPAPRSLSFLDPRLASGAPHEILVVGRAPAPGKPGAAPVSGLDAPGALRELGARRRIVVNRAAWLARSRAARELFPGGAWVLRYEGEEDPETVAQRLREDPAVLYAGPNHLMAVTAAPSGSGSAAPAAEDSLFALQYALTLVGAPQAWERSRGDGVLVAVIDTGVDVTHPDLAANIHVNVIERDGILGVDDDGNGYVDDILGYDFTDAPELPGVGDYLERDPDPSDEYGHGTQVAGVIAAIQGNGIGIAGVAPDAEILALRAGFNTGLPFLPALLQEDDAAEAILYAVDSGADILNLSWGDLVEAPLLGMVVRYARERGVLVVAGAGNDTGDHAFYPAAYAGVVSAGACDRYRVRASFSTYGQDLDLLAPGVELWTTSPGGGYGERTGTSFSSPMIAGAAALVWSRHPTWTADQVAWQLRMTAQRQAAGWTTGRGWGILDAAAAVADDRTPPVAQIEGVRGSETLFGKPGAGGAPEDPGLAPAAFAEETIFGTAAVATLNRWTLSVLPESVAVHAGPADAEHEVPGEQVLVRDARRQVVAESLAVFSPGPSGSGPWVARLRAWAGGRPAIDKRLRFAVVPAALDVADLKLELQVARDRGRAEAERGGWDLVATWTSQTPYRGSAVLRGGDYSAEEASVGTHHAVRLTGPLPVGESQVKIRGRGGAEETPRDITSRTVEIPTTTLRFDGEATGGWPSGTPMRKAADWNGNGLPEFFAEAAPAEGDLYGAVERYELAPGFDPGAPPVLLDSSQGRYTGIPLDICDSDGDGLLELLVFRLDGWNIYEEDQEESKVPIRKVFREGPRTPVPVGFTKTSAGTVLVAVSGGGLAVYAPDAEKNWGFASDAPASDVSLLHGGAMADFDGNGVTDAFFADAYGRLFWFTINGATVRYTGQRPTPVPLAGALLAVPGDAGRWDLLTTEVDPPTLEFEGDLDRAAVRVRRWSWDGVHLTQRESLAFGGLTAAGDLRLQPWRDRVLLTRGTGLDVIGLEDGGLQAGGGLPASPNLSRVDGSALALVEAPISGASDLLWRGNSRSEEAGERIKLASPNDAFTTGGPPLRVTRAEADGDSLDLSLAWDDDGCEDSGGLLKILEGGLIEVVSTSDRRAHDRIALGDRVTYQTMSITCVPRTAEVFAAFPQEPAPVWDGPERLVVEFDPPLRELPQETLLRRVRDDALPTGVSLDRNGTRLLVTVTGEPPTELALRGAWDTNGLPIGGYESWRVDVPEPPAPATVPVLATVSYANPGAPTLEVTVSGGAWGPSCDKPFRLEPPGWDLAGLLAPGSAAMDPAPGVTPNPASGDGLVAAGVTETASLPGATSQVFAVPLPAGLAPGPYTLSLRPDCLAPAERGPGQELTFQVGVRVYPNPLQAGDRLTVDNLGPGSRATLVDVSGREVLSWRVETFGDRRTLAGVAPGLYFLRLESPQGQFLSHHKLLILR